MDKINKVINKIFSIMAIPAKFIFIIGGFTYALWFAIRTGMGIENQWMNVIIVLLTAVIGMALICVPPVFVLIKKDEIAKIVFMLLLGYWIISGTSQFFFFADTFAEAGEFYPILVSIFLLLTGLMLIAVLVLAILSMFFKTKIFSLILLGMGLLFVAMSFLTAILFCVQAGIMGATWIYYVEYAFIDMILLPVTVGCGIIYFFGVSGKEN